MKVLDDLNGFEFEELMVDVFRHQGYRNVQKSRKTGDEGRDIVMEEPDGDGVVVVECKHTATVSRPVVQKLHSAVSTYPHHGPKRGVVVTTGQFTGPAVEYAEKVNRNDPAGGIELLDGDDLRDIGDDIGLDLYSGNIEILCDETLVPPGVDEAAAEVRDAFLDVENFDRGRDLSVRTAVTFLPMLHVRTSVDAVFETTVGVVNRIRGRSDLVLLARRDDTTLVEDEVGRLVGGSRRTVPLRDGDAASDHDEVSVRRFGKTETEYKEDIYEFQQRRLTETVTYTGDNSVTYEKTCTPNRSDIDVHGITPVYLPRVEAATLVGEYRYEYEFAASGSSSVVVKDGIRECVHCGTDDASTYTFCANCGSVNCPRHIRTERLEGTPVCTGCAVTEQFFFSTKYFYDRDNLEAFREEYESMPFYRKPLENRRLVAVSTLVLLVAVYLVVNSLSLL